MQFSRPWTRAMPSATDSTVPTSARSALVVSRPSMRLLRIEVISSGLICMFVTAPWPILVQRKLRCVLGRVGAMALRLRHFPAKLFEARTDGRVHDEVADPQDDPTEDLRVDLARELDLVAGLLADPLAEALDRLLIELDRAGDGHRQQLVALVVERLEVGPDPEDHGHPVALDERLQEVHDERIGSLHGPAQPVLLLLRGEVRRKEEHGQLAVLVQRVGELAELLPDRVELVLLRGDLEEGAGVYLGDLFHVRFRFRASPGCALPGLALASTEDAEVEVAQGLLHEAAL